MKICKATILASLAIVFSSCAPSNVNTIYVKPESEMGRAIRKMDLAEKDYYVRRESTKYLAVAQGFVRHAQERNLEGMLNLTSSLTVKVSGRSHIKKIYETEVIPQFLGTKVRWNQPSEIITDDTGNRGYLISGKASGPRSFTVYVTVMKERGKFRVITISQKR